MRYTIGQKIVVMFYQIEGLRSFFNPMFVPWEHNLKELRLEMLTVVEHHKVAWDQDPNSEKKYDGFVLTDAHGNRWSNQYPRASYSQVSDAGDYYFNRIYPDGTDYGALTDREFTVFEDVTAVLDRVSRGVHDLSTMPDCKDKTSQLTVHLDWLTKKIERETGAKIEFVPLFDASTGLTHSQVTFN